MRRARMACTSPTRQRGPHHGFASLTRRAGVTHPGRSLRSRESFAGTLFHYLKHCECLPYSVRPCLPAASSAWQTCSTPGSKSVISEQAYGTCWRTPMKAILFEQFGGSAPGRREAGAGTRSRAGARAHARQPDQPFRSAGSPGTVRQVAAAAGHARVRGGGDRGEESGACWASAWPC
jgi:hypothetical protein